MSGSLISDSESGNFYAARKVGDLTVLGGTVQFLAVAGGTTCSLKAGIVEITGSGAVALPTVTSADNGKILKLYNTDVGTSVVANTVTGATTGTVTFAGTAGACWVEFAVVAGGYVAIAMGGGTVDA